MSGSDRLWTVRRPRLLALLALFASLAFGTAACRPGGSETPRRIFFISVDTLRADHLGAWGYERSTSPFLDRLASEGVLFERAIAQWPKTGASFASVFTGQYPLTTGLTHRAALEIPETYLTLPELFQGDGWATLAVVSNAVLSRELGWHRGFDSYAEIWKVGEPTEDPLVYRRWIDASQVNAAAGPLFDAVDPHARLFAWIHYSDPHGPYILPPGAPNPFLGDARFESQEEKQVPHRRMPPASRIPGEEDLRVYEAQYDANVLFVDQQIEALWAGLEARGWLENACVVFTADHGESLGEHDYYFGHGLNPYHPGTRVPLFFWGCGIDTPQRWSEPVELLDLYPTLRDLAAPKLEIAGLEGRSLLASLRGRAPQADRLAFTQAGGGSPYRHWRAVEDSRWKLVYHPARKNREGQRLEPIVRLFDLVADPGETTDVAQSQPEERRRLLAALSRWQDGRDWIRPPKGFVAARSAETEMALRALGYVE